MHRNAGQLRWILLVAIVTACVSGCGQKGDLYLPDDRQSAILVDFPDYV